MTIVGKTYLERGRPVVVEIQWGTGGGPRNVLIRREDGTRTVRPFRGLRGGLRVSSSPEQAMRDLELFGEAYIVK